MTLIPLPDHGRTCSKCSNPAIILYGLNWFCSAHMREAMGLPLYEKYGEKVMNILTELDKQHLKTAIDNFFTEEEAKEFVELMWKESEEQESPLKGFTITCNNCGSTDVLDGQTETACKCGNKEGKSYWSGNFE